MLSPAKVMSAFFSPSWRKKQSCTISYIRDLWANKREWWPWSTRMPQNVGLPSVQSSCFQGVWRRGNEEPIGKGNAWQWSASKRCVVWSCSSTPGSACLHCQSKMIVALSMPQMIALCCFNGTNDTSMTNLIQILHNGMSKNNHKFTGDMPTLEFWLAGERRNQSWLDTQKCVAQRTWGQCTFFAWLSCTRFWCGLPQHCGVAWWRLWDLLNHMSNQPRWWWSLQEVTQQELSAAPGHWNRQVEGNCNCLLPMSPSVVLSCSFGLHRHEQIMCIPCFSIAWTSVSTSTTDQLLLLVNSFVSTKNLRQLSTLRAVSIGMRKWHQQARNHQMATRFVKCGQHARLIEFVRQIIKPHSFGDPKPKFKCVFKWFS